MNWLNKLGFVTIDSFHENQGGSEEEKVLQVTQAYFLCCCSRNFYTALATIYRSFVCIPLLIFFMVDYFSPRANLPTKTDYVIYFVKPTNWISFLTLIWLFLLIIGEIKNRALGQTKRPEFEPLPPDQTLLRVLAFASNLFAFLCPAAMVVLVFYYEKIRFDLLYFDQIYEMDMVSAFVIIQLEILFGLHYVTYRQVIWTTLLCTFLLIYVAFLDLVLGFDLYTNLNWKQDPGRAALNSIEIILVYIIAGLGFVSIGVAKMRCLGINWFLQPPTLPKNFDAGV